METEATRLTTCCKLEPQTKMPTPAVLRALDENDVKLLKQLLAERVEYISNPLFDRPEVESVLMQPLATFRESEQPQSINDDSGVFGLDENGQPLSRGDCERLLFLRLNYCRRRVLEILRRHNGVRLSAHVVQDVLHWERAALETRSEIVRKNVPLVLAMAKRTRIAGVDLTDLISEGNLALLRAVFKFDCARGYKFSTYACRAILKSFSRVATRMARHRGRFPVEFDPELEKSDDLDRRRGEQEDDCIHELRSMVEEEDGTLSDVERKVIRARFALDADEPARRGKTLEQVGEMIGVTKERVRQIQNKALGKLRSALESGILAQ